MRHFEALKSARIGYFRICKKIAQPLVNTGITPLSFHERAGIRTPDNLIKSQVLYHLSYTPIKTGLVGFEPTNAGVKVLCLTAWR